MDSLSIDSSRGGVIFLLSDKNFHLQEGLIRILPHIGEL